MIIVAVNRFKKLLDISGPIILILYFAVGMMAYVSVWPGSTQLFRSTSLSGILSRGLTTLLLLAYGLAYSMLFRSHRRFPFGWAVSFSLVLVANGLVSFLSDSTVHYFYKNVYGMLFEVTSTVGYRQILTMYLSSLSDFALAFCFMFLLPKAFKKTTIIPLLILILAFMVYECAYCAIFERDKIVTLLSRSFDPNYGYDISIGATFGDKQEFGCFLTVGVCASMVLPLIWYEKYRKTKILVSILCCVLCLVFLAFSLIALCKTAIIASSLCILCFLGFYLVGKTKENRKMGIISWSIAGVIIACVVLFFAIPQLHSEGIFKKLYDFIDRYFLSRINHGIFSRFYLVETFFSQITPWNFIFGLGKGLQANYMSAVSGDSPGLHTGFVYFQACYGIVGSLLYACAFFLVVRRIISLSKKNIVLSGAIIGTLVCSLVFNISENVILIFSGSTAAYLFNLVCVTMPEGLLDEKAK